MIVLTYPRAMVQSPVKKEVWPGRSIDRYQPGILKKKKMLVTYIKEIQLRLGTRAENTPLK